MPKVYRAMRRNPDDGLPVVGSNSTSELGARLGEDFKVDEGGAVILDGSGMSVAPHWRSLPKTRIPRRLKPLVPGASGSNNTCCFTMGVGTFSNEVIAPGLVLVPDRDRNPVIHGVVAPMLAVPPATYQADLEATRLEWQVDET